LSVCLDLLEKICMSFHLQKAAGQPQLVHQLSPEQCVPVLH